MRIFFQLCLIFIISTTSFSQTIDYTHFDVKNGLAHDITYKTIQDSTGYIYISTDNGISKFNGYTFETIYNDKGSNFITDIHITSNQDILFSTWGSGSFLYSNNSKTTRPFANHAEDKIAESHFVSDSLLISKDQYSSISILKKDKYSAKTYYLVQTNETFNLKELHPKNEYSSKKNKRYKSINSYYHDGELTLFSFYTKSSFTGLLKYNLKTNQLTKHFRNITSPIHSVLQADSLYLSSKNHIYITDKGKIINQITLDNLKNYSIYNLNKRGNILFFQLYNNKTGEREFAQYNLDTKIVLIISDNIDISSMISNYFIDKEGNIWLTTYGSGVYYIKTSSLNSFDNSILKETQITDMYLVKDSLFLLSPNHLYLLDTTKLLHEIPIKNNQESFQINQKHKQIYVLSSDSIENTALDDYQVTNKESKIFRFNISNKSIKIANNSIVIQSPSDTLSFNSKDIERIRDVKLHNTTLLVLWENNGLLAYDINTGRIDTITKAIPNSIPLKFNVFQFDTTGYFCGTTNGLYAITKQGTLKINEVLSPVINDLHFDKNHVLWIGNQKGLNYKINNNIFGLIDGIKSTAVLKIVSDDNFVYVSGNKGVSKINMEQIKNNTIPYLCRFIQDNSSFSIQKINFSSPKSFKIEYSINTKDWIHIPINENNIDLKGLSHGVYEIQFRYKTLSSNWVYSSFFIFNKAYPFYYYILGISIFILATFILHSKNKAIKINKIHNDEHDLLKIEMEEIKINLAQDFHDELGNKIAIISMLSSILETELKKEKSKHKVKIIKQASDDLYNSVKNYIWLLNSDTLKFNESIQYLIEFGESIFINHDISFAHSITSINTEETIDIDTKQIVLIFKEIMTNTLKHSKTKRVQFNVFKKKQSIIVECIDYGSGFNIDNLTRNNGLSNMKKRAFVLNAVLQIDSIANKGTHIRLILK